MNEEKDSNPMLENALISLSKLSKHQEGFKYILGSLNLAEQCELLMG
jgi:hypothetical protein